MIPKFKQLKETTGTFCEYIVNNPMIFFSEADLQALFFKELLNVYDKLHETSYQKGPGSESTYSTLQVHREYGLTDYPNSRMDLVVLPEEDVKKIDSANLQIDGSYIKPIVGFELGTHKVTDYKTHLENDVKKLKNLELGILLYFLRDEALSSKASERGKKTMERIADEIMEVTKEQEYPDNILPLIFIIQIQKKDKIWGKCRFYSKSGGKWIPVNLSKIKDTVINELYL